MGSTGKGEFVILGLFSNFEFLPLNLRFEWLKLGLGTFALPFDRMSNHSGLTDFVAGSRVVILLILGSLGLGI